MEETKVEESNTSDETPGYVKAWEKTGLLEGAEDKLHLAEVLETCGKALIQASEKIPQEQAGYIAMTCFAVLVRALRSKKFTTDPVDTDLVETVFVKAAYTPQEQIQECIRAAAEISSKLEKYNNLNISTLRLSNFDNGYHIGIDCNSVA